MFNRILLPVDRSPIAECVIPHAITLAHAFRSQVTLVHVMDLPHQTNWRRAVDPLNWQIRKNEATAYLDELAHRFESADVSVDKQILEGQAAEQVIEFAHANELDLIILSSHGQSGLSDWNVSSVVHKIAQRAGRSIMIVRAYQPVSPETTESNYHRLLIPIDGSQRAECILPVATTLARLPNTETLLAHVVKRPELPRRTPPPPGDIELVERLVERNRTEAERYLEELRSQLSDKTQTRVVVSEHVTTTLHEIVDQETIDLVLLSAHGCSGEGRWAYGSVVASFIAYGITPLLILQDVAPDRIPPTRAELAAREHGR